MITKNHEDYIEDCIDSLLSQDLKLDHIVVCDDSSEDDTYSKLENFEKYRNISIYRNSYSLGPSSNSNKALSLVKSDYVIYTSGDDVSKSNRSKIQLNHLLNTNSMCVINDVEYLIQDFGVLDNHISTFLSTNETGLDLFKNLFWKQNFLNASCACFSKDINFDKLFNPDLLYLQDFDLWLKLSIEDKIISRPEKLLKYRISNTSLSQSVNQKSVVKQSMHAELFQVLFNTLSEMSVYKLDGIFGYFLASYSKSTNYLQSSEEVKYFLIYFLLLSHNNAELRKYVVADLQTKGLTKKFMLFMKNNFRFNANFIQTLV